MPHVAIFVKFTFRGLHECNTQAEAIAFAGGAAVVANLTASIVHCYHLPEDANRMGDEQDASQAQAAMRAIVETPPF
jgi:hypothetical protein